MVTNSFNIVIITSHTYETTDHISTVPGMSLYMTDTRGSNEDMTDQFLIQVLTTYHKYMDMKKLYSQRKK